MDPYFEELLTDTRQNRKGFPLNILMELSTLKDYYQAKVFPTRHDAWDLWAEVLADWSAQLHAISRAPSALQRPCRPGCVPS
jgi:hypothetical protein